MAYSTFVLTGTYQHFDGSPARGTIEIIPSERVVKDTTGDVILSGRVKVTLDSAGSFTATLPHPDDLTLNPAGFGYTVAARLRHQHLSAVSFGGDQIVDGTLDIEDVTPVDPSTFEPTTTYAESAEVDALGVRVTTLEQTPAVTSWDDLTDKPAIPSTAADVGADPAGTAAELVEPISTELEGRLSEAALSAAYARRDGTTYTGTHDFTGATVTGISGGPTADTTTWLPASNGTDDTAAVNAILATATGKYVRGRPGTTYLVTGPLVLPSPGNVVLDMTGCTVRLKAGSPVKNLLNNASVTALRTVTDAAITTGTTTLTSATAAFVTADVGRWVRIAGAAVSGDLLVARITARTNASTVTIDTAASTTVTGATLNVHEADHDIIVTGGTWDHGSSAGTNTPNDHAIRIRYAERVTVRDMNHVAIAGKYAINLAAVTDYLIENHTFTDKWSDGVHLAGPARRGVVRNLQGSTSDDLMAVTAQEPTSWEHYDDSLGIVDGLVIENIHKKSGNSRVLHLVPGRSAHIKNVFVRNVTGTSTSYGVYLWGDGAKPGGRFDNVVIENVATTSTTLADTVMLWAIVGDNITLRNIRARTPMLPSCMESTSARRF
jgi:hypothetical protein